MQMFYYKKVAEEALELAAVPFDKSNLDHSNLLVVSYVPRLLENLHVYFIHFNENHISLETVV